MDSYVVIQRTFLFPAQPLVGTNHPILEAGTKFEGIQDGVAIKTTIGGTAGFVSFMHAQKVSQEVEPLVVAGGSQAGGEDIFCDLATVASRREKADRDYLLSVACYQSDQLTKFGNAADPRIGPFRFSAAEWAKAAAKAKTVVPPQDYTTFEIVNWRFQINVAAIRAADAAKIFEDAVKRPPTPHELFFFERLDLAPDKLVELLASGKSCKDAITGDPEPASYAAIVKAQDAKPFKEFAKEVQEGLMAGYGDSRAAVNRLPPHLRFFHDEDWAPWVAVARQLEGDNLQTSTNKLKAQFMSVALPGGGNRSAIFVGFCLKFCGVKEAQGSVPANVEKLDSWKAWQQAAATPAPVGAVVISGNTIGILAEPASATDYLLYVCTVDAAGATNVAKRKIAKDPAATIRWLDLTAQQGDLGKTLVRGPGANLFEQMAPGIMSQLLEDFKPKNLSVIQAAAILGNIGHECGGFRHFQELAPTGGDGRGGFGWCQWTDTRRTSFENFCNANKLSSISPAANYRFLVKELKSTHAKAITDLVATATLRDGVIAFELVFEVALVKAYDERERYGNIALAAFQRLHP